MGSLDLRAGETVGRYRILERLGDGEVGVVYAAYDGKLERKVALKVLRGEDADGLLAEARAGARLAHPNVVALHDADSDGDRRFVAMEYVDGEPLPAWLAAGPRPWREVLAAFVQAGRGLLAARCRFEPSRVLVGKDGRVRVSALGLGPPVDERADLAGFAASLRAALAGARMPGWLRRALARPAPSLARLLADLGREGARGRLALYGLAAVALAALALVGGRWLARRAELCKGAERRLNGVWDPARKSAVRAAFLATGKPYAGDAWQAVEKQVDAYAGAWTAMHQETCLATQVRHAQSEEHQGLRMVCLGDRLAELRALTRVLGRADDDVVKNAGRVAGSLSPLDGCADVKALGSRVPPPADPAVRAKVDDATALLDEGHALRVAGKFTDALSVADQVVATARPLGYRPLEARALLLRGRVDLSLERTADAHRDLEQAVLAAEAGRDDDTAAQAWTQLAFVVGINEAKPDEGLRLVRQAEAQVERMGGNDPDQAEVHDIRGGILSAQGKFADSLASYQKALELRARAARPDETALATSHNNIGQAYQQLGQFDKAKAEYEQALGLREKLLGPRHVDLAHTISNLGAARALLGDNAAAEADYRRALALREEGLGPDHPDVAETLTNLALLLGTEHRLDEALATAARALAIFERAYGPEHPMVAQALINLGLAQFESRRTDEAQASFERALAIAEKVHGPEHPDVSLILSDLSQVMLDKNDFDKALVMAERALAIDQKLLGEHPQIADDLQRVGTVYGDQGRQEEALAYFRRALAMQEKLLGPDAPELAGVLSNIADRLQHQHKDKESIPYALRAIALDEKALGADHPDLIFELAALGGAYRGMSQPQKAIEPLEHALRLEDPGRHPEQVARVQLELALALWDLGRDRARAEQLAVAAREGYRKLGMDKGVASAEEMLAKYGRHK